MTHSSDFFDSLSVPELLENLATTEDKGLTLGEAKKRLLKYGPNILPEAAKISAVRIFFEQFATPLMLLMTAATIISAFLGEWFDVAVLMITISVNAVLGFFEEYKADRTMLALQSLLSPEVRVMRDGFEEKIPQKDLVPGDILILRVGDQIPADGRVLMCAGCEVDESILTGESVPVLKDLEKSFRLYAGTTVSSGRMHAVVTKTGIETSLGRLAARVNETISFETPLQVELKNLARSISIFAGILIIILSIVGLFQGYAAVEMFRLSVAIAVSAIPEGLAISVTVMLAVSMRRMLRRKALIRKLIATETLGSVTVICTDKTGTMTTGKMALEAIMLPDGKTEKTPFLPEPNHKGAVQKLLIASVLCNDIVEGKDGVLLGSSTERGLFLGAADFGISVKEERRLAPRVAERPFDPVEKCMITVHSSKDGYKLIVKGAPESVLLMCNLESKDLAGQISSHAHEMTSQGLRLLAVAEKKLDSLPTEHEDLLQLTNQLESLGFVGLRDPLRPEATEQVKMASQAGVATVMVTGDHPETAVQIARRIGLPVSENSTVTGVELDALSDSELSQKINDISVFARVSPQHKIRLVEAYLARGAVVAMTGDGVNDAPALKRANIGIALGSGTEVAKQAADMVLIDNNLSTITAAIEEGRIVFDNIRRTVTYLMVGSLSEVVLIGGALLFGAPLPLLATQILWINLVVDGLPSLALSMEEKEQDVMLLPPRNSKEPVLNMPIKWMVTGMVLTSDVLLLFFFIYLWKTSADLVWVRTMIFAGLGFGSIVYIFPLRSFRRSIFKINPFSNHFLILAVGISALLMLVVLEIPYLRQVFSLAPLSLSDWGLLAMIVALKLFFMETIKQLVFWRYAHRTQS